MNRAQIAIASALFFTGCAAVGTPPPTSSGPRAALLGEQLAKQDQQLVGQRFRTLLDFEHDADAVFVKGADLSLAAPAHTGAYALKVEGSEAQVSIDPLLYGKKLPADWTLLGAYVHPLDQSALTRTTIQINTRLVVDGRTIARSSRRASPQAWAFVGIDLTDTGLNPQLAAAKSVQLVIDTGTGMEGFLLDDVLLVNNQKLLVSGTIPEVPPWKIEQDGFATRISFAGQFTMTIPSSAGDPDGWSLQEASPIRTRFVNIAGQALVIYPDGRVIQAGHISLRGNAAAALAVSQRDPATVTVDNSTGRLMRDSPGDKNNDGYDESRGSYQIIAKSNRLNVRIAPPADAAVARPVLEIKGLVGDHFSAMIEGRLFESICRVDPATVLVYLPITIDRPSDVTLKASANLGDSVSDSPK